MASQIELSASWEAEVLSCLSVPIEFHYLSTVEKPADLIVHFKKLSAKNNDSTVDNDIIFGEKGKMDGLITMDDVSGLADRSSNFVSF